MGVNVGVFLSPDVEPTDVELCVDIWTHEAAIPLTEHLNILLEISVCRVTLRYQTNWPMTDGLRQNGCIS